MHTHETSQTTFVPSVAKSDVMGTTRPFQFPSSQSATLAEHSPETADADIQARLDHASHFGHDLTRLHQLGVAALQRQVGPDLEQEEEEKAPIQAKLTIGQPGDKYEQEADAIQAQAFTHGQDIYFNSGKYEPGSSTGKGLLAHELTHTLQQTGNNNIQCQSKQSRKSRSFWDWYNSGKKNEGEEYQKLRNILQNKGYRFHTRVAVGQRENGSFTWGKGFPDNKTLSNEVAWNIQSPDNQWYWMTTKTIAKKCQELNDFSDSIKDDLLKLLRKGEEMTPEESSRAQKMFLDLGGDDFREILIKSMESDSFQEMLSNLDFSNTKVRRNISVSDMEFQENSDIEGNIANEIVINTTLLKPARNTIRQDFKRANEIYSQHDIEIEQGNHLEISEQQTKAIIGVDTTLDVREQERQLTIEQLSLIQKNRSKGRITGYWLPTSNKPTLRGEAFVDWWHENLPRDRESFIIMDNHEPDTLAHEIGHVLDLEHDDKDPNNLMASGSIRNTKPDSKGGEIDKLSSEEVAIIRRVIYLELGRKGIGK